MIKQIFRQIDGPNRRLKCLTGVTHESFETSIAKTDVDFYALCKVNGLKPNWNTQFRPIPPNYSILDPNRKLSPDLEFDFVLSQNRFGQFQTLLPLAQQYNIPVLCLEHTLPAPWWNHKQKQDLSQMRGNLNIFISEHSIEQWGFSPEDPSVRVVHHCVDELFKPIKNLEYRDNTILTVGNDFINRDVFLGFKLWNKVTENLPRIVIGDTKGLSEPAKSAEDLLVKYNSNRIYINPSQWSPIPCSLLEAAACGCAIVSTSNCLIPTIFTHEHDALLTNDEKEMREYCELLLNDLELCQKLGENARKTILEKCSTERFVKEWNKIFRESIK